MSKRVLLPMLSILVLIPLLALFLASHFSPGGALAGQHVLSGAEGPVELELVGRWPYGRPLAITSTEVDGILYALLGSAGVVLVLDMTAPSNPTKVGEAVTPGVVQGLSVFGDLLLARIHRRTPMDGVRKAEGG